MFNCLQKSLNENIFFVWLQEFPFSKVLLELSMVVLTIPICVKHGEIYSKLVRKVIKWAIVNFDLDKLYWLFMHVKSFGVVFNYVYIYKKMFQRACHSTTKYSLSFKICPDELYIFFAYVKATNVVTIHKKVYGHI